MDIYRVIELSSLNLALTNSPYEKAAHLMEQKNRLERAIEIQDFPLVLDCCRSLLESICKTILTDRVVNGFTSNTDFKDLFKSTFSELFKPQTHVNLKIQKVCSGFIHNLGELRNSEGAASHGKDAFHAENLTNSECELLIKFSDAVAGFLLHNHANTKQPSQIERIHYEDYPEFNDYFDAENSMMEININDMTITENASQFLYRVDQEAYKEAVIQFMENL